MHAGGVVKQKTMHQSSFRQAAVKTTLFFASAFFVAHFAFGKPNLAARENPSGKLWPSLSGDSVVMKSNAIYAQLSMESRQLLTNLQNIVNRSGSLPSDYYVPLPFVVQAIGEWGVQFASSPKAVIERLEASAKGLKAYAARTGDYRYFIKYLNTLAQLQVLRALQAGASPEAQKRLLDDFAGSKTFVVPTAEE